MERTGLAMASLVAYAARRHSVGVRAGARQEDSRKGSWLMFQMHYTPNGVPHEDRSSIGLIFAKEPPKYEVRTRVNPKPSGLEIPPGDSNYVVRGAQSTSSTATRCW